jgi:hypothetical protein
MGDHSGMKQINPFLSCRVNTAIFALLASSLTHAQSTKVTVAAFDGKSGKPLTEQRLLIFVGETQEEANLHKRSLDLVTGKDGSAVLHFDDRRDRWIQVFVDFHTLCQSTPRAPSLSVGEIITSGLSAPNTCGSVRLGTTPSRLNVYARAPTLREKMAW